MIFKDLTPIETLLVNEDYEALNAFYQLSTVQSYKNTITAPIMVSAHQLKHLNKIDELPTDSIMINLEDGVAPEYKYKALQLAKLFIANSYHVPKSIIVRINALEEGGIEEIKELNEVRPYAIRIPKIKNAQEVQLALDLIDEEIDVHLSVETKEAWNALHTLTFDNRVTTLYLGILDLFADLKLSHALIKPENPLMHYMLSHFLIQCKILDVRAVSFVFQEYKDIKALQKWLDLEKSIGYSSKGVISPDQALCVMQNMFKDPKEIERAKTIIKLFKEHEAQGITGFTHETYGFIDEPIYKGALALLEIKK